jgi:ribosomal protein L29
MLTIQELRSSTDKELMEELQKAQNELMQIRIGIATRQEKDTSIKGRKQRYVATIKTVLKEIQLEEAVKNANAVTN